MSTPDGSRTRVSADSATGTSQGHRRRHTTTYGGGPGSAGRAHRIVSAPLRLPPIPGSAPNSSSDADSDKSRKANRKAKKNRGGGGQKDGAHTHVHASLLPAAEIDGLRSSAASLFGVVVGPGGASGSPPRRGRNTRGKMLGASETAEERAAAQEEAALDKEKARALEDLAALTLAHEGRERGTKQVSAAVRHNVTYGSEPGLQKHRKLRGKALHVDYTPSESETTMVDQQVSVVD